jgi:hypothetical protein
MEEPQDRGPSALITIWKIVHQEQSTGLLNEKEIKFCSAKELLILGVFV